MKRILLVTVASLLLALGIATTAGSAARVDTADTSQNTVDSDLRLRFEDSKYNPSEPQLRPAPGECMVLCVPDE